MDNKTPPSGKPSRMNARQAVLVFTVLAIVFTLFDYFVLRGGQASSDAAVSSERDRP